MVVRGDVWLALAVGHLGVVILGASCLTPDVESGGFGSILRWYAAMSGADSSYGFFAPAVGSPHRSRFVLRDNDNSTWTDTFDRARNSEARLRLTGIVDDAFMSGATNESPEWRKRLISSWAATMFNRHPSAVSVTVIVDVWCVPDMASYRAGKRPHWEVVYRAEIQRCANGADRRLR